MGINVWTVDKEDQDGYSNTVDICETFDEAVDTVFEDWGYSAGCNLFHSWLSEPEPNEYSPERGFYIYEYMPQERGGRLNYTYYIYNWIKE